MIELIELQKHINELTITAWKRLFDIIPRIESSENLGELKLFEKDSNGITQLPIIVPSKLVDKFCNLMYELDLVVIFNWPDWTIGKVIIEKGNYEKQDTITLLKIFSAFIRVDRFNEGFLVGKFEDGTIEIILKELKKNIENKRDIKISQKV